MPLQHRAALSTLLAVVLVGSQEMLLLEAVTLYGFGNWCEVPRRSVPDDVTATTRRADVGDHVGTKNEDECFDHYLST